MELLFAWNFENSYRTHMIIDFVFISEKKSDIGWISHGKLETYMKQWYQSHFARGFQLFTRIKDHPIPLLTFRTKQDLLSYDST